MLNLTIKNTCGKSGTLGKRPLNAILEMMKYSQTELKHV